MKSITEIREGGKKDGKLFVFGGSAYAMLEIICRRKTHWSMFLAGGTCFLTLFKIFKRFGNMKLPVKCVVGSTVITAVEFVSGCIVNLKLNLNVWDYTKNKHNVLGQICPLYSFLWALLTVPISGICKKINEREQS